MKKFTLKPIFMVCLVVLLTNCQQDEINQEEVSQEVPSNFKIENVSLSSSTEVYRLQAITEKDKEIRFIAFSGNTNKNSSETSTAPIVSDKVIKATDQQGNIAYSVFFIKPDSPAGVFYNLVGHENADGSPTVPFVIRYTVADEAREAFINSGYDMRTFKGKRSTYHYSTFFAETPSFNTFGINGDDDCEIEVDQFGDPVSCKEDDMDNTGNDGNAGGGGSTGGGGGGYTGGDGYTEGGGGYTGGGGGYTGGGNNNNNSNNNNNNGNNNNNNGNNTNNGGNTGGGESDEDIIGGLVWIEDPENPCTERYYTGEFECDDTGEGERCTQVWIPIPVDCGGTGVSSKAAPTFGINDPTITCVKCADGDGGSGINIANTFNIINNLTGKAKCIFDKINSGSTTINDFIKNFDGEFPVAHLKYQEVNNLPNNVNGKTSTPENYVITISLNGNTTPNRASLMVARTILHETIHAEMFRKLLSILNNGGDFDGLTKTMVETALANGDFPGILNYYTQYGINGFQHQQMAAHYRNVIADGLADYDNNANSYQFYLDISWVGLKGTDAWNSLSSSERHRIDQVISNFRVSGSKTCN